MCFYHFLRSFRFLCHSFELTDQVTEVNQLHSWIGHKVKKESREKRKQTNQRTKSISFCKHGADSRAKERKKWKKQLEKKPVFNEFYATCETKPYKFIVVQRRHINNAGKKNITSFLFAQTALFSRIFQFSLFFLLFTLFQVLHTCENDNGSLLSFA